MRCSSTSVTILCYDLADVVVGPHERAGVNAKIGHLWLLETGCEAFQIGNRGRLGWVCARGRDCKTLKREAYSLA